MAGPDFTSILAALQGTDKAAAADDPFTPIVSFSNTFGNALAQAAPKYGLGEDLLAGLATGLVGGIGQNLSTNYENTQKQLSINSLNDLISGKALGSQAPDGMNASVFQSLRGTETALNLARMQKEQDLTDQAAAQIAIHKASNTIAPELRGVEAKILAGTPLSDDENALFTNAPLDQQHLLLQARQQALVDKHSQESIDMRGVTEQGKNSRFDLGQGLKLSHNLETAKVSQDFQMASSAWDELNALRGQNTQSAALGMIKAGLRLMNPGASIKEGTFNIAVKNPNNYSQMAQDFLSEIKGEGQLSPEHEAQWIAAAQPFVAGASENYRNLVNSQLDTYSNFGQDASRIKTLPMPNMNPAPAQQTYTADQAKASGYSDAEIAALRSQGLVQ